jgi:hypothetical protein
MEKLNRRVAIKAPREPATWPGAQKNSAKQEDFKRFVCLLFAVFQELFNDVKAGLIADGDVLRTKGSPFITNG